MYNQPKLKNVHGLLFLKDKIRIGSGLDYASEIPNPENKYTLLMKNLRIGLPLHDLILKTPNLTPNEIKEAIDNLFIEGYIEGMHTDVPSWIKDNHQMERYETNLNFFDTLPVTTEFTNNYDYQTKIHNSQALIIGMGGIGTNVILSLLELGIGKITAVDFDRIELKNLNRQVLYSSDDIGKLKSSQAQIFAKNFNPNVEFIGHNQEINSASDIEMLIEESQPDFIVNVADYPTGFIDFWVNDAAIKYNVPIFAAVVNKKHGKVYSVIPGKTACYNCQYLQDIEDVPDYEEELNVIQTQEGNTNLNYYRSPNVALGPSCLFQGYYLANEIMRYIFQGASSLLTFNKRFNINFLTNEQYYTELKKYDQCKKCGEFNE
ncbi:HesA/MoeB/ThiF family protein [Leuconostoc gasicomitatum]|uniref:HesA/MoeB/ThiF family protein n=1 Tax=Leuconostoc gasicomitatum TaxID=115778 RepID=UPI001CC69EF0|nr:ThiF family adenylyltransferase [Leuconostoc gasicomitatum]MBZ5969353.1 ThiF family adenylyltransferase [Leuconostoc gasicomitatum]MBZ5997885.1 ThiF family adenylyltransferase [Leuconostoc gasicomitatum]